MVPIPLTGGARRARGDGRGVVLGAGRGRRGLRSYVMRSPVVRRAAASRVNHLHGTDISGSKYVCYDQVTGRFQRARAAAARAAAPVFAVQTSPWSSVSRSA